MADFPLGSIAVGEITPGERRALAGSARMQSGSVGLDPAAHKHQQSGGREGCAASFSTAQLELRT